MVDEFAIHCRACGHNGTGEECEGRELFDGMNGRRATLERTSWLECENCGSEDTEPLTEDHFGSEIHVTKESEDGDA